MSVGRSLSVVVGLVASVLVAPAISTAAVGAPSEPTGTAPRTGAATAPVGGAVDDLGALQGSEPVTVVLQLPQAPASRAWTGTARSSRVAAVRAQREQIKNAQTAVVAAASRLAGVKVRYRVSNLYNGVVVSVPADKARTLTSVPGVTAVRRVASLQPDNSSSDALIGAPQAWQSHGGLTGQGVRIGIIDSGIDYTHRDFGGSGNFAGNTDRTRIGDTPDFPSAKVAGGYDFVGDAYNGSNAASPDPDPSDCSVASGASGHGTHVAATAAGYGENTDGSTYTGPYDSTTPLAGMKIGPGVAPGATLYALRVFGCSGGTGFVPQALDWAMDPNGDGDFSDHLDVVNMSLGSDFGSASDISSVAADNAVAVGVQVVISAGNSGDVTYVTGSPGSATRAVTVASSVDAGEVTDGFTFTGPGGSAVTYGAANSSAYPLAGQPDVTAPLYVPTERFGCSPLGGTDATNAVGKIVLWDWRAPGATTFPCGSATRATNAANAGAVGMIVADNSPTWSTNITGSVRIPSMITNLAIGAALKAAVPIGTSGGSVTFSARLLASVEFDEPGRADTVSSFSSRGPRLGDNALKPDISAPGDTIFSAKSGSGSDGVTFNGTSMAAPHLAGTMALLHQLHPTWTPEQLKALVMNAADADLWSGRSHTGFEIAKTREGVGRLDVAASVTDDTVAYGTDSPGAVSLSFGSLQVLGTQTAERTIAVVNQGSTDASYDLAVDPTLTVPGVSYDFPDGATVDVPAGGQTTVRLRLTAVGGAMNNTTDPTLATTQLGNPRSALSESTGHVLLTPRGATTGGPLRVAYLAVVRPASAMGTDASTLPFTSTTPATTSLTLTGTGVDTGGSRSYVDEQSLVTALTLGATSPRNPALAAGADLRAVGATSTCRYEDASSCYLTFGVQTYGTNSSPADRETAFTIGIDTNADGVDDYRLTNEQVTSTSNGSTTYADTFVSVVYDLKANTAYYSHYTNNINATTPSALFNSDVIALGVDSAQLGNPASIRYTVSTGSRYNAASDTTPRIPLALTAPGLEFEDGPLYYDRPGAAIAVRYDPAAYAAQGSSAIMLIHHFNRAGSTVQLVPAGPAVTSVQVTPTSPSLAKGTATPLTATALLLDGTTQDVTALADWSSSDPAVTVGNTSADRGVVTGTAVGSGTVTATYGGSSGSTGVTVTDAVLQSVAVTPADGSLPKGTVQQYAATGTYSDGSTQDLTGAVAWSTGDLAVATIDAAGRLTAAGTGTTTVTATLGAIAGSTGLTVTAAALTSIAIDPSAPVVHTGTHLPLHATGVYSDGTTADLTATAVWATGDPALATVDADGVLAGVAGGSTTVTATSGAIVGSAALTVSDAALQTVAITPAAARLAAGTQRQFTATGTWADGTQDLTADAAWTSSAPAVAAVSNTAGTEGLVTGLTRGAATLTATANGVAGTQALTVTPAVLRSLAVTTPSTTVARGESPQFTATGTFSDGSTQDLTASVLWTSGTRRLPISDATGSRGLGVAVGVGSATVTARRGTVRGTVAVTITPARLARIEVADLSVAAGTAGRIVARGVWTDGATRPLTDVAAWQVTDPAVAAVAAAPDGGEFVTGVRAGATTVTATFGGVTGTATVTVTTAKLRRLSVTPARLTLAVGSTRAYTVRGTFSDGSTQDLTDQVGWSSSAAAASVSNAAGSAGSVTAVAPGSVTITATLGTVRGTGALTVVP